MSRRSRKERRDAVLQLQFSFWVTLLETLERLRSLIVRRSTVKPLFSGFRFGVNDYIDEVAEYVDGGIGRCGATTSGVAVRQQVAEYVKLATLQYVNRRLSPSQGVPQ